VLLTGVLLLLALATASIWLPWIGQWLVLPHSEQRADAIAVFGGGSDRTCLASRLYRQGMAPQVWHTGWRHDDQWLEHVINGEYPHRQFLDTVPEHARQLRETTSTWEDAQEIAQLASDQQPRSLLVITDWFHSRRALCTLRHRLHGSDAIAIYYVPVPLPEDDPTGTPATWWQHETRRAQVLSEYLKLGYYLLRYGVVPVGC
jgi:uncharacterized SAM-binding protein YcdF (DUF218 family)